ncbi:GNAT family N-acetyltransferase [Rhodovibrio salinarum]|uniref:GNAT family N-acetyltransferase n=2 Tax=Rhodovibrio salinarum TaxID=1087 RepID=A0A934QG02_9PROT|nr:GNAT family N-acetyltransferase [Rhodovibrio salinarum]
MLRFHIGPERPDDAERIEPLLDRTFGDERRQKTVYRLRAGVRPVPELCFVATDDFGKMLASLRFWPIQVAGQGEPPADGPQAILLGPLSVEPKYQGRGIGRALVRQGLDTARRMPVELCVVVGEPGYYQPYGFIPATPQGLILPGPVEPRRFQVLELKPGALEGVRGRIRADLRYAEPGAAGRHLRRA